jgi:predicted  nucleic acid-binding Zn-ribbon protein
VVYRDALRIDCKVCGKIRDPGERFSVRGKCLNCGNGRMVKNKHELQAHRGPLFDHWRKRCLAAFGVNE